MSDYKIPSWASKPPTGYHLDVTKDEKLIQKLMIDEKGYYLFGRNSQLNDFTVDHSSCSRVHAALLYHKHLARFFLVDCGSTHGTFIGNLRIEEQKPTQLATNIKFHFGASTRSYQIRERPQTARIGKQVIDGLQAPYNETPDSASHISYIGLPKSEIEIDNLTEFNTARNRQSTILDIVNNNSKSFQHKKKVKVNFQENEEIINPEDIDPNVGRFQNMVETQFIPNRINSQYEHRSYNNLLNDKSSTSLTKRKIDSSFYTQQMYNESRGLYDDIDSNSSYNGPTLSSTTLSTKLGFSLPNPAPHVENQIQSPEKKKEIDNEGFIESKKKKYPIESWPGRSRFLNSNV